MSVTAVMGVRLGDRSRRRNAIAAIRAVRDQDVAVTMILVEQDVEGRADALRGYVDLHLFRRDPGLYSRARNFNYGAQLARTDFLLLMDADVLLERDVLRRCLEAAEEFETVLPFAQVLYHSPRGTQSVIRQRFSEERKVANIPTPERQTGAHGGVMFIRRSAYVAAGGHDERFEGWGGEDDEFFLRIKERVGPVTRLERPLHHLHHPRPRDVVEGGKRNYRLMRDIQQGKLPPLPPNQIGEVPQCA